ncbi:hypothetical protein AQ490_22190 [Wenjunlia vitaminophila]|uniref:Uncharacterized protein n=1 Tax=Wenjunlia vitaminophila TaxID=76728 RepID=A0A0T6LSI3_WENVI|nr:hypothetical protein [Wenjunlia vitaminophila]KRV49024.1 hypothetical protein AQ490_22190 [Wenjunlia vitaminophila]
MSDAPWELDGAWRPYTDEPVLTPAMTDGYDAVCATERDRLRLYLEALVARRGAPVHVTVAFNAAYFGYGLAGEGYGDSPLDPDGFPGVTLGERIPALPVGAMVRVTTGSQPLFAEIVYKEGRARTGDPDSSSTFSVPDPPAAGQAGAESADQGPAVRRELLVPDPHAFGPGLSLAQTQLNRLRHHHRWINQDGHVLVDAVYPSRAAAHDDVHFYADYLLTVARDQLLSPFVPVSLPELAGSGQQAALAGALRRLLAVVERTLETSDALRMWGRYAVSRNALAAGWRDQGPLGRNDMERLVTTVQYAATPASRRRRGPRAGTVAHTAVGPRLREFPGAAPLLSGVGYAAAVCRANLALADVIRRETEDGVFENGTRVSLEDDLQDGGLWRSCDLGGSWWNSARPGDNGTTGTAAVQEQPMESAPVVPLPAEPLDAPLADDARLGCGQLLRIDDSEVAWLAPLRLAHLLDDYLPLRPIIADGLRMTGSDHVPVRLELTHLGEELEDDESVQDVVAELTADTGRINGVCWPIGFFPGLVLRLQWPRGGRVIRITTIPREVPEVVEGRTLAHEYDSSVLTRETAPGSDRAGDTAAGLGPRALVMRAVRRCGLLTDDGHALLDRSALPSVVYGQKLTAEQAAALDEAADALIADGRLYPATGSRDGDGWPHHPARRGEPEIALLGYDPDPRPVARPSSVIPAPKPSGVPMTPQYVHGHLRRLRPGASPSEQQRAAFREHCRRLGKADGWELPANHTFVNEYTKGQ